MIVGTHGVVILAGKMNLTVQHYIDIIHPLPVSASLCICKLQKFSHAGNCGD